MASDIDIVNLALTKLGQMPILQLTDNTKQARSANRIYALERDAELRSHIWNFATARALLPALATAPAFGYGFAYQLPEDWLAVIEAGDFAPGGSACWWWSPTGNWGGRNSSDGSDYKVEGKTIVTNLPAPLALRYTRRVTDPAQFDSAFVMAFGCRLAMALAEDLTNSTGKRQLAAEEYKAAITAAIRANAVELPPDPFPDGSWLLSRLPG